MSGPPTVAIFGASGLIGEGLLAALQDAGLNTVAIARRFTPAQRSRLQQSACELDFMALDRDGLAALLAGHCVDVVINCVGVLQDGPRGSTHDVHVAWISSLLGAMPLQGLLIHLSVPGEKGDDRTPFSHSKHEADAMIAGSGRDFVIVRPGFVLAPVAYGGSALLRAVASLAFSLAEEIGRAAFRVTHAGDIAATVIGVLGNWRNGQRGWRATWDVMATEATTVDDVVKGLSDRLGGPVRRLRLPAWLLRLGAIAGDAVSMLGWTPPIRSTALAEMRRGVTGNPQPWIAATGLQPTPLADALRVLPVGVQERWFGRFYLLKPLVLSTLSLFWIASGLIALTVAFPEANALLRKAGLPDALSRVMTVATSLLDIAIGLGIAFRRSARWSLWAGFAVSLLYLAASVLLLPELWADPVGAMVKTAPVAVLLLVGIATLDDR
jgi:uncharacterized protein YbjT (DUF2867 family)